MKIVLTGATGFVGGEVVTRLDRDPAVTHVTCLVRRTFAPPSPKIEPVVLDDFTAYPRTLVERLADHDACIWTLGGKDSDTADPALYTRITHDFTLAFAAAIAVPWADRRGFTFCYLSGAGADPGETARLPWQRLTRHVKGRTEKDLRALAARHRGLAVRCFRPGGILPTTVNPVVGALVAPISIRVDRLADALVAVAVDPTSAAQAVLSNAAIKRLAASSRP
jgi:nucleoside-diphosphate-sugar epimerase